MDKLSLEFLKLKNKIVHEQIITEEHTISFPKEKNKIGIEFINDGQLINSNSILNNS